MTADDDKLRSANVDRFNHDDVAAGYDRDVLDESHPIRAGYDAVLGWVAGQVPAGAEVIDLGCGTGNLSARLANPSRIWCVDISQRMLALARAKLADREIVPVVDDLLASFNRLPMVDAVASTFAIHHLTPDEKATLFGLIDGHVRPGGVAAFGDLMFRDRAAEQEARASSLGGGDPRIAEAIDDEFFWYVDEAIAELERLGFATESRQLSPLAWVIAARKPA